MYKRLKRSPWRSDSSAAAAASWGCCPEWEAASPSLADEPQAWWRFCATGSSSWSLASFLVEALCFERLHCLLGFLAAILGCLGLSLAMVDPAESRLEPFRRGFALLVLALRLLETLSGCWELLVPGWLGQLACPFVERPGRG